MLKEAIEKIVSLAAPTIFDVDGHTYCSESLDEIKPDIVVPQNMRLYSIDALVKMIKNEALIEFAGSPLFIEVSDSLRVSCFLSPRAENSFVRPAIYTAEATDVPGFSNRWMSYDEAMIKLRSMFIPNEGTEYLLKVLSSITDENSVNSDDNGMTQNVTVRKGIALQSTEQLKPIVKLIPYRTFQEVEQPESEFLIRVREGGDVGFFEADGGMWKLEARKNIVAKIEYSLWDEIQSGKVVAML